MTDADAIQKELQDYLVQKNINNLFISIVEGLLLEKPDNPIKFIIKYLKDNYPDEVGDLVPAKASSVSPPNNVVRLAGNTKDKVVSDTEEESEEEDQVGEIEAPPTAPINRGFRRTSVSAESVDASKRKSYKAVIHAKSEEEKRKIRTMIEKNILFANLDEQQLEILLNAFCPKDFEPGDLIIKQGDSGDYFYVVESGICEIYKDDKLVLTATEAMSFGELALMYNAPRAATVKAKDKTKVWALDRLTFKVILMDTTMTKRDLHKGFLDRVPILEGLDEYERLKVADSLRGEKFADGEVIIRQGDDGDKFYIVEEGDAICTQLFDPAGKPNEVGKLQPGSYFGEIALLTSRPRQATVTAVGNVKCLTLDRKTFMRVMGPLEDILKRNMEKYQKVMAHNI